MLVLLAAVAARRSSRAAPTGAQAAADGVTRGTIYQDGPDNRYLLGGEWLFRRDDAGIGLRQAFQRQAGRDGWTPLTRPERLERRRQLRRLDDRHRRLVSQGLPPARRAAPGWTGSCASSRSTTARACGSTASRSAATPAPTCRSTCACRAARSGAPARTGSSSASTTAACARDFPPSGLTGSGDPAGGWWNYGGLLREVYLQRVDTVDVTSVVVRPQLPCATCDASVARARRRAQLRRSHGERAGDRQLRLAAARPRPTARRRAQLRELPDAPARGAAAPVVAGQPVPLPGALTVRASGRRVLGLQAATAGSARSRSPTGTSCSTAAR